MIVFLAHRPGVQVTPAADSSSSFGSCVVLWLVGGCVFLFVFFFLHMPLHMWHDKLSAQLLDEYPLCCSLQIRILCSDGGVGIGFSLFNYFLHCISTCLSDSTAQLLDNILSKVPLNILS